MSSLESDISSLPFTLDGSDSASALLEVNGVTKRFGSVTACADITLRVSRGEILGLLGQNGAGKSTLMKVVVGVERADLGQVMVDGALVPSGDPAAAARAGIGMVHQHFSLVGRLTVWQNVVLGEQRRLDSRRAVRIVKEVGEKYGLEVDPYARIDDLSAGMRQRVEIIKCLRADPKVIILDEPTSVLTLAESMKLFEVLRGLVHEHGYGAILISHRLSEILYATDRVTVLRGGRVVADTDTRSTDAKSLANLMLGRDAHLEEEAAALGLGDGGEPFETPLWLTGRDEEPRRSLSLTSLVVRGEHGNNVLDDLSLEITAGEIVGIAGVEGNGQGPLVEVLSGLASLDGGSLRVRASDGTERPVAPGDLGVIPADRHDSGCILQMSVAENLVMSSLREASRSGVLSRAKVIDHAVRLIEEYEIAAAGFDAPLWSLSGGNQQKVVLARELSACPSFVIAEQPTRGLDVGAMEYMWNCLRRAAGDGAGVLLLSTELDEILALSTRIVVLFRGRIVGEMSRDELDLERLGLMMGGQAA